MLSRTRRTILAVIGAMVFIVVAIGGTSAGVRQVVRNQLSCVAAAREYTGFTLRGNVQKRSCHIPLFGDITIELTLDSAMAVAASQEAATQGRYRRMEDVSPADSIAFLAQFMGRHGWYYSTFGKAWNGGYTLIALDETRRSLRIEHYFN